MILFHHLDRKINLKLLLLVFLTNSLFCNCCYTIVQSLQIAKIDSFDRSLHSFPQDEIRSKNRNWTHAIIYYTWNYLSLFILYKVKLIVSFHWYFQRNLAQKFDRDTTSFLSCSRNNLIDSHKFGTRRALAEPTIIWSRSWKMWYVSKN